MAVFSNKNVRSFLIISRTNVLTWVLGSAVKSTQRYTKALSLPQTIKQNWMFQDLSSKTTRWNSVYSGGW